MSLIAEIPSWVYLVASAWICLTVGSFINVVAYRLPLIMQDTGDSGGISLSHPSSHCPTCTARIPVYLNIPVLGYLIARGRCHACETPIPVTYPLVELSVGVLGVTLLLVHGFNAVGVHALLCFLALAAAAAVDHQSKLLPSAIVLPLTAIALLGAAAGVASVSAADAIFGAAAGLLACFIADNAVGYFTGKQGLADGDWRLCAAIGAILGPLHLLPALFIASAVAFPYKYASRYRTQAEFPFGPPLVFGATAVMIYDLTPLLNFILVRA